MAIRRASVLRNATRLFAAVIGSVVGTPLLGTVAGLVTNNHYQKVAKSLGVTTTQASMMKYTKQLSKRAVSNGKSIVDNLLEEPTNNTMPTETDRHKR